MKLLKRILFVILLLVGIAGLYFIYGLYINPKSPLDHAEYKMGDT